MTRTPPQEGAQKVRMRTPARLIRPLSRGGVRDPARGSSRATPGECSLHEGESYPQGAQRVPCFTSKTMRTPRAHPPRRLSTGSTMTGRPISDRFDPDLLGEISRPAWDRLLAGLADGDWHPRRQLGTKMRKAAPIKVKTSHNLIREAIRGGWVEHRRGPRGGIGHVRLRIVGS